MAKAKHRHSANYVSTPKIKEWGASMTKQNDSYTIKELLLKHQAGISTGTHRNGNWDEDASFDQDVSSRTPGFDLVDAENIIRNKEIALELKRKQQKRIERSQREQSKLKELEKNPVKGEAELNEANPEDAPGGTTQKDEGSAE